MSYGYEKDRFEQECSCGAKFEVIEKRPEKRPCE